MRTYNVNGVEVEYFPYTPSITLGETSFDGEVEVYISYLLTERQSRVGNFTFSNQPSPVINGNLAALNGTLDALTSVASPAITDPSGQVGRVYIWQTTFTPEPGFVGTAEVSIPTGTFGYTYRYLVDAFFDFGSSTTRYIYDNQSDTYTSPVATSLIVGNSLPNGRLVINGALIEGVVLEADTSFLVDLDGLGPLSYQWQRDGVDVAGARESSYTLTQADVGAAMSVVVSYIDGIGTAESVTSGQTAAVENVNDAPTGAVEVTGAAREDQVLTADTVVLSDLDGLGPLSYQWQRDGVDVAGATSSSYTLTQADVGAAIRVVVSYTDGQGTAESVTSGQTAAVENVNDAPTGAVEVTGAAREDQVLTADTVALSDLDGLGPLSYQWQRDGIGVAGATSSSYTLTQADVGAAIRVVVSYTDGQGTAESVTSGQTAAVENVNDAPTGAVEVTGAAREDQVLTADMVALSDLDGLGPLSYPWQRDGVDVAGARESS